jgi:hypothetical protein
MGGWLPASAGRRFVERRARCAYLRQLNRGFAHSKALSETELAAVEAASREVLVSCWIIPTTFLSVSKKYATVPTVGMWNFGAAMRPPFASMARIAWSMLATEIVHSKPIIFCPGASSRRSCKPPRTACSFPVSIR